MYLFAPHITDGYKPSHEDQYSEGTSSVTSNFTPRSFTYATTLPSTRTGKVVFIGIQYAIKHYLIDVWNSSFFDKPKADVVAKMARRLRNYLGKGQGQATLNLMSAVHDLGYLPLHIKALPEGSRINPGIPAFVVTCTKPAIEAMPSFHALVNYVETVLSTTIWPMCNSASLMEQYYLLAKNYGNLTGASPEYWLPFAIHNFSMRGMRGVEDGIMSAFGHSLFHAGTDTFAVIDFAEEYYGADSDNELIGVSVNASEHATVCQQIAVHGGGHDGEVAALKHFLTDVYPTGVFSYVSDSRDYWDVIANISLELKDVILSRGANENGQPGILTFRPDSSPDTPYEILLGYNVYHVKNEHLTFEDGWLGAADAHEFCHTGKHTAVKFADGSIYAARLNEEEELVMFGRKLGEAEAKGTLQVLWENFGGRHVSVGGEGGEGYTVPSEYKLLDDRVRIIYGEAISLQMAEKIYSSMMNAGWCVGNVLFGVGSWAFLSNSSRDSYGWAMKATNSVVDGVEVPLQKDPKGTSSFKKSARGRLRVEWDDVEDEFVLYDNQSEEDEKRGLLRTVFIDGECQNEQTFAQIQKRLK